MPQGTLEVTVLHAVDVPNVSDSLLTSLAGSSLQVEASLDATRRCKTAAARNCGTQPQWCETLRFRIIESHAELHCKVFRRTLSGKELIGHGSATLSSDFFKTSRRASQQGVMVELRRANGRPAGHLSLTLVFHEDAHQKEDQVPTTNDQPAAQPTSPYALAAPFQEYIDQELSQTRQQSMVSPHRSMHDYRPFLSVYGEYSNKKTFRRANAPLQQQQGATPRTSSTRYLWGQPTATEPLDEMSVIAEYAARKNH